MPPILTEPAARSQGCSLFCDSCHRRPFDCLSCFALAFCCCLAIFCFCILLLSFFPPLSPMVAPFRVRSTISPWKRSSPSRITRPDPVVHLVPPCVTGAESNTCGPMRLAARSPLRRARAVQKPIRQSGHLWGLSRGILSLRAYPCGCRPPVRPLRWHCGARMSFWTARPSTGPR